MRLAVLVLVLASCRQIFGLHELADQKDAGHDAAVDAAPLADVPVGYYRVGGTVTGLTMTGLKLELVEASEMLDVTGTSFTFATGLRNGPYTVMIAQQPLPQTCTLANATGTIADADVTNVAVTCSGGRPAGIQCTAQQTCVPIDERCCAGTGTFGCATSDSICQGGQVDLRCDDAADCMSGQFCCAGYDGANNVVGSSCASNNQVCGQPNPGGIVWLCDPGAAAPCPTGMGFTQCTPSTLNGLPAGYYQCQ
jgi:hypothetical protein